MDKTWNLPRSLNCAVQNDSIGRGAKIFRAKTKLSASLKEAEKKKKKITVQKGKIVWEKDQKAAVVSGKKKFCHPASSVYLGTRPSQAAFAKGKTEK